MFEAQDLSDLLERTAARRQQLPPPALRRVLRMQAGLIQQDIASLLGVNRAAVARYELGQREPRGPLRLEYARILSALAGVKGPPGAGSQARPDGEGDV